MAGHSKWAQIKRKKAVLDGARSKIFGKYAQLITIESKRARGDSNNPQLKAVVERAKSENMPKDAIVRAIERGTKTGGQELESVLYEMFGPGGVAILIDTITDSRNRTVAELRHLVRELGYELATPGSAMWAFSFENRMYVPHTTITLSPDDETRLLVLLETLDNHQDVQEVYSNALEV
jgi:YebC/PmpR family DNA-binding regulatory protein